MTTPDKAKQPEQDAQELQDEQLDQVSGGRVAPMKAAGVSSELEDTTVTTGAALWGVMS